jgi:hypothetical protein
MIPIKAKRPIGYALVVVGIAGVLLGAIGIYQIWQAKSGLETSSLNALAATQETLLLTQSGLTNVSKSLTTIDTNISTLNNTILTVAQSLNDAVPVLDSISSLLQDELPTTLEATQTSLETAEASAQLLDSVMRVLTAIPFYPGEPYDPEVPLHVSVQNVAASLEKVPGSLIDIGSQLENNKENFSDIEDDLITLSITLTGISTDISIVKTTLGEYQNLLTSLGTQIDLIEERLAGILATIAWFLTLLIFWLILTQIGLIIQGLSLTEYELFRSTKSIASEQ